MSVANYKITISLKYLHEKCLRTYLRLITLERRFEITMSMTTSNGKLKDKRVHEYIKVLY